MKPAPEGPSRANVTGPAVQRGRLGPAGVGLLVFGVLMLYFGLKFVRGGEHPLAATVGYDLCTRLGPQPAADLADLAATPSARIPDLQTARASTCYWPITEASGDTVARNIGLVMMTHATLRAEGSGRGSAKYAETFIEETRASGAEVAEVKGPWKSAATIRNRGAADLQLMAEDDGVVLWWIARGIDRDALIAFASATATELRAKEKTRR